MTGPCATPTSTRNREMNMHPTNPGGAVKVKRDGARGWHWITVASFDASKHQLVDPADAPLVGLEVSEESKADGKLTADEIRAALTAKGIPFDKAAKKADLQALLDAAPAA